jgi:O-antigen/teichoic acid export membrane protein
MFGVISMVIMSAMAPLWPAYGEALARHEFGWVTKTLKRSIILVLAVSVPANIILVLFSDRLLRLWVGNKVTPSLLLLVGLALWSIVSAISVPISILLNGAGIMKAQAIIATISSTTNLALSVFLTYRLGVVGVCLGSAVTQLLIVFPAYAVLVPRLLKKLTALNAGMDLEKVSKNES